MSSESPNGTPLVDEGHERALVDEGHERALAVLRSCVTEHGFLASPADRDNYRRIWARDGCIMSLAALLSGADDLIDAARQTLTTLAEYQGPHGEIPSNVDPVADRVSYGGTTGRVDAGLWFTIGCVEVWRRSGDDAFLDEMLETLERLRALLGAWEFNARGLLYVPPTGDWADEYVQSGYVLYDQLLYLQAQRGMAAVHAALHGGADHALDERIARLTHLLRANYWFEAEQQELPADVYHDVLYRKGRDAAGHCLGSYWLPFFSPLGYGTRFDGMANSLVSLLGVSDDQRERAVDAYVDELLHEDAMLLPAFDPVITPRDEFWDELQMSFSYTFKNQPHEYHNGGLWPLVTGFYAASLARRGRSDRARVLRDAIHRANRRERGGEPWSFSEYLHGRTHEPGGTTPMGWSAAAALIADAYVDGERLFGVAGP